MEVEEGLLSGQMHGRQSKFMAGVNDPCCPITQWWEQVANMELAEWGDALRGSCGGSSLLTLSLGRQSCELIPRSPTVITALIQIPAGTPSDHLPPKGLLSQLPQHWQSSTAHRRLLRLLLAKESPQHHHQHHQGLSLNWLSLQPDSPLQS